MDDLCPSPIVLPEDLMRPPLARFPRVKIAANPAPAEPEPEASGPAPKTVEERLKEQRDRQLRESFT